MHDNHPLETNGHVWKLDDPDDYGPNHVDEFALSYGYHNGPECVNCGYSFCQHCKRLEDVPPCSEPQKGK